MKSGKSVIRNLKVPQSNNSLKNYTMKHLLLFVTILLLATGCSRDDDLNIQVTDGDRLVSHVEFFNSSENWTVEYFYDDQGTPVKSEATAMGIFIKFYYVYDEQNRLLKIKEINDLLRDTLLRISEHFYDEMGRLERISKKISFDHAETYLDNFITEIRYHYDENSQIYRKEKLYRDSIPDASWNFTIENFYYQWEDNNIAVVEEYNRMGELAFTREFEYDNKVNYKLMQPEIFVKPEKLTQNNVTREVITDHLNHLPSSTCTVCRTTYRYNASGKPVKYRTQKEPDKYFVLTYK